MDWVAVLAVESSRFADVVRSADLDLPVPSCPGWTVADLTWHLAEVQDFWGGIVEALLLDPSKNATVDRPPDRELSALFDDRSARLIRVLSERDPGDQCWSWNPDGQSVGWVRRRQAHEALIHRVDAELAVGMPTAIADAVAADGVDEMLTNQVDSPLPEWGSFAADGTGATIRVTDADAEWHIVFGRFTGTSPNTGTTYDEETFTLTEGPPRESFIEGSAVDMDLWLWGRGDASGIVDSTGGQLSERIRTIAAIATN